MVGNLVGDRLGGLGRCRVHFHHRGRRRRGVCRGDPFCMEAHEASAGTAFWSCCTGPIKPTGPWQIAATARGEAKMKRVWREFWAGWNDARWGDTVLLALLPLVLVVALIVQIAGGQVPPWVVTLIGVFGGGILVGALIALMLPRYWRRLQHGLARLKTGTHTHGTDRRVAGVVGGEAGDDPTRRRGAR
jgi:hypothetical protein